MPRRTKILATLGPGSSHDEGIRELIVAGVNVFRLNFSHGSAEEHTQRAQTIRSISQALKTPVGILCDMQGPKIRIGSFTSDKKIDLVEGDTFTLDSKMDPEMGDENAVFIAAELLEDIEQNDTLLLDDGRLTLQVTAKTAHAVNCVVIQGGILSSKKGVNKFGGGLSAKALTEKDKADIKTAAALNTDYLAISFVQSSDDVEETRQLLTEAGSSAHIIAKVERAEAITPEFLPGIIESADGVMVARGDLGVEIGDANLVAVQKQLIEAASAANKVVITCDSDDGVNDQRARLRPAPKYSMWPTQSLMAQMQVMLSAETAVGKYPVETGKSLWHGLLKVPEKHPLAQRSKHRTG
jgi:pyruvate kinase